LTRSLFIDKLMRIQLLLDIDFSLLIESSYIYAWKLWRERVGV